MCYNSVRKIKNRQIVVFFFSCVFLLQSITKNFFMDLQLEKKKKKSEKKKKDLKKQKNHIKSSFLTE